MVMFRHLAPFHLEQWSILVLTVLLSLLLLLVFLECLQTSLDLREALLVAR